MDTKRLRLFVILAEELHFGRAAKRAGVAQSVLSVHIKRLEDELGLDLFARTKREVRLTPSGQHFLYEARAILDRIERGRRVAASLAQGKTQVLRVAMTTVAMLGTAPQWIGGFKDAFPKVDIQLLELGTVDQEMALADGEIDIGFLHPPLDREDLRLRLLAPSAFFALRRKSDAPNDAPVAWANVLNEPLVFYGRRRAPRLYDAIISSAVDHKITIRIVSEALSFLSAASAASAGIGTALLPEELRSRIPENSVAVSIEKCPLALENAVAYRVNHSNPAVDWFMQHIQRVVGLQVPLGPSNMQKIIEEFVP